jgi:Response regulator containing CheY-like receiver, AAA-type ATPase, and DNA-binding domains
MKALIVEDDMLERKALARMFEICFPAGFDTVSQAVDGASALRFLQTCHYDLVMLDINLPDISGTEVLKTIQTSYPESKVIMTTAYSDYPHLRDAMRNNAQDYLVKPYSLDTFREAVQVFLSSASDEGELFGSARLVRKVKKYLEENYGKELRLTDVASYMNLDKSYLGRVFKKETGQSVMAYLNEVRLREADMLLRKGRSVAEAAYDVGFRDPEYFSRCYKKSRGHAPSLN